jgi:hypothetical protein
VLVVICRIPLSQIRSSAINPSRRQKRIVASRSTIRRSPGQRPRTVTRSSGRRGFKRSTYM